MEQAHLHLLQGNPKAALADLHLALDDGIPANNRTGQPQLLAATDPECGYAWGIVEGLHHRAEALLLQAAQTLGSDSFVPALQNDLPKEVQDLIAQANTCLTEAMTRWRDLRDPEVKDSNFIHPETGDEYNYRAEETDKIQKDLEGGLLTRYPLQPLDPNEPNTPPEQLPPSSTSDTAQPSEPEANSFVYDAFISYRHIDPDRKFARDLVRQLEAEGYKVAIDERDFIANQTFLDEMERCTRESRFTLAVISPQYFQSGNTEEEAIIRKVRDMAERKRGLIPLTIAPVDQLPVWLYDVVGVDYNAPDPLIPPFEKLKNALGKTS